MARRRIVDAHHHLWNVSGGYAYPWLQDAPGEPGLLGDIRPIARDYLLDDYLADTAGYELVKSVHVEAAPLDGLAETRWLQEIADENGFPHAIVAHVELDAPDLEKMLAEHRRFPNVRGVRHMLHRHEKPGLSHTHRDLLADPAWLAGFGLLAKHHLSFDMHLYSSQLAAAADIARRHPETLIVLDHTGIPVDRDDSGIARWREGMRRLAANDNVLTKISGLGMVDWHWSEESIRPFVLETIDIFGVDRAMFASNFPVDRLYASFDAVFGAFERIVSGFSETEKHKLFHDNAIRAYRL